jgi:hypothetical protein
MIVDASTIVGASTIDREFLANVVLGDGRVFGGVSLYSGDPLVDFKLPLVYATDCGNRYCYMGSLEPSKVTGKIVVCDREGNERVEKGSAVKLAGGLGLILANIADSEEELISDSHTTKMGLGVVCGNPQPTRELVGHPLPKGDGCRHFLFLSYFLKNFK